MELDEIDHVFGDGSNALELEDDEPLFLNPLNQNLINVANDSSLSKKRKLTEDADDSMEKENKRSNLDALFANAPPLGEIQRSRDTPANRNDTADEPEDYSRPPSTGAFITATTSGGEKLYFPKKARPTKKASQSMLIREHMAQSTLLAKPIWRMLEEMELEAVDKLKAFEEEEREHDERLFNEAMQSPPKKRRKDKQKRHYSSSDNGTLWVDKYRPTSFVDLLGDQVNTINGLCVLR
jgi:chromosome transmission fidelity protein 18